MKNFIASCALVTAVCFGVVAVSGSASAQYIDMPYGRDVVVEYDFHDTRDDDIPVSYATGIPTNGWRPGVSSMNLYMDSGTILVNQLTVTDLFTTISSTTNYTTNMQTESATNGQGVVRGSLGYFTYTYPISLHISVPSEISFTANSGRNFFLFMSSYMTVRYSNTSYYQYTKSSVRGYNNPMPATYLNPSSVDVFFDDILIGTFFNPSSSYIGTSPYDFLGTVYGRLSPGDYSLVTLRFNYNYDINYSWYWYRGSSYNASNYTTYIVYSGGVNDSYLSAYGGAGSWSYDVVPLDTSVIVDDGFNQVHEDLTDINDTLKDIQGMIESGLSNRPLTPMEQFESDYLDNFEGQISQTESALSSSNPALPNGGDIGGFVSDVSDGLGLSGSSFNASDFNSATSGFSGSSSTGLGGPWEFFTQGVADDLAGDGPSSIDDFDPIIAWMEQAERRRQQWGSYNP